MGMKQVAQQAQKMNMTAVILVLIVAAIGIYMFVSTMK
jgi:septal ring-binding cell division protein DamX